MSTLDLDHALAVAEQAIDQAAQHFLSHRPTTVRTKGDRDITTNVDDAIELLVKNLLHQWNPRIGFLGEEHGASGNVNTYWVLDPIDGTTNFAHSNPLCAIALALIHERQPVLGITALPFLGRRYWAVQGQGAFLDGDVITVSGTHTLGQALIGLGDYGSGPDAASRDPLCENLDREFTARAQGLRRYGSTALDLVWVADGTLDACVLIGNRTWDTASGAIIAREAGALVLDVNGCDHSVDARCIVAVTPGLRDAVLSLSRVAYGTKFWECVKDATKVTSHPAGQGVAE